MARRPLVTLCVVFIVVYRFLSFFIVFCRFVSFFVVLCCFVLFRIVLCRFVLLFIVLCRFVSSFIVLCRFLSGRPHGAAWQLAAEARAEAHRRRMMDSECIGGHAYALRTWAEDEPDGLARVLDPLNARFRSFERSF